MARIVNFKEQGIDLGDKYIDVDDSIFIPVEYFTGEGLNEYAYGSLYSWGQNTFGELGSNNRTHRSSPVQVGALTTWKKISGGTGFVASVNKDGTLWSWGHNQYGQLASGNVTHRSSPVQVGALANWKLVDCGNFHSLATKTDGTLWSWGFNSGGQLGDGTTVRKSSPVQVGALTDWKEISVGVSRSYGIRRTGELYSWGDNVFGALGLGNLVHRSSPVQVGALTNWNYIAANYWNGAAIKTDGTLWTWGRNNYGQLGVNDTISRSSPIQVGAMTDWKFAAVGAAGSCFAIKKSGTLWSWGYNSFGELGQNTNGVSTLSSPVQVGTLTNWKLIKTLAVGVGGSTYALTKDGQLWTWGRNNYGQLGSNTRTDRSSPVQVGSLGQWTNIGTGLGCAYAIRV